MTQTVLFISATSNLWRRCPDAGDHEAARALSRRPVFLTGAFAGAGVSVSALAGSSVSWKPTRPGKALRNL